MTVPAGRPWSRGHLRRAAWFRRPVAVEIHGHRGDVYLVHVRGPEGAGWLCARGRPVRFRSAAEASRTLAGLGLRGATLVTACAHDEVVGRGEGIDARHTTTRIPLAYGPTRRDG